MLKYHIYKIFK